MINLHKRLIDNAVAKIPVCTTSRYGRMVYIYPEKDLRAYPGTIRGTEEWDNTYKILLLKETSITSKIISVLQDARLRIRKI